MESHSNTNSFQHDSLGLDAPSIKRSLANSLTYSMGKDRRTATQRDWFNALAYSVRDRLAERWRETLDLYHRTNAKRVYYLSLEFLIGRLLSSSMCNIGIHDTCQSVLDELGLDLSELRDLEPDAALGNGGLGRLAACFLDSMATLDLPGYGYGIRYEYGLFHQGIENGFQIEHPDNWLRYGNPWEFPRPEVLYPIKFYGKLVEFRDEHGQEHDHWVDAEEIMAMAYDTPVPGFRNKTVNTMRLWAAKASRDFELKYFNEGNYIKAVEEKNQTENLAKVLYPSDTTTTGKELRLKQQYSFVSASLQDILRRFLAHHQSLDELPDKVDIQLNDTHPSVAIPELMRLLLDIYKLGWDKAWDITVRTFSYTNHTLLPEALETWPVEMFERILPRHLKIIYDINLRFLREVTHRYPGDMDLLRRVSIIGEEGVKHVRMSHLAIVGSHQVNGVAKIHTELMKSTIFADLDRFFPGRIINITNGVTPRRWLNQANHGLRDLISAHIGQGWVTDLGELRQLLPLASDAKFRAEFRRVKQNNKERLAAMIQRDLAIDVDLNSMFDVQIKRIHEYKRQLLNVLHVVTRYNRIRQGRIANPVPRTVIFGGKAAPDYHIAKLVIKLINDVADIVNNDPTLDNLLKVAFLPNYDVSLASLIIPATDLSEQISTAGTEASGTGNMKLALNGALTIGTLDGANVEIRDEVGDENIFIFGHNATEVAELRRHGYNPWSYYHGNGELKEVLDMIGTGFFSPEQPDRFRPIFDNLTSGGDYYMLLADYGPYIECQDRVDQAYRDSDGWTRKTIINTASMGRFSSDRSILEYAEKVWDAKPASWTPDVQGATPPLPLP